MSDRLALANAIEDAGIERSKAQRVASVIFDAIHDNVATKADVEASAAALRGEIAAVGADVRASEAAVRADVAAIRGELRTEIQTVRSTIAAEASRLDTRIERLDAKVELIGSRTFNRLGGLMVVLFGLLFAALRYLPPPGHGG
jgi:hypothetical protein